MLFRSRWNPTKDVGADFGSGLANKIDKWAQTGTRETMAMGAA